MRREKEDKRRTAEIARQERRTALIAEGNWSDGGGGEEEELKKKGKVRLPAPVPAAVPVATYTTVFHFLI